MAKITNKSKKIFVIFIGLIFGICLCMLGANFLGQKDKSVTLNFSILSTETGEYFSATSGGRVYAGENLLGINQGLECNLNQKLVLTAKANDGYGFAGYYINDDQLICSEEVFAYEVNSEITSITAKFAKLYPLNLTLTDPFDSTKTSTINTTCFVGQYVNAYDIVKNHYDEEYAKYYLNSGLIDCDSTENVFASGNATIKAGVTNLSVQPSPPVEVGVPSGYNQYERVIVLNKNVTGMISGALVSNSNRTFTLSEDRPDCAIYTLSPWDFKYIQEGFKPWLAVEIQDTYVYCGYKINFFSAEQAKWSGWQDFYTSNVSGFSWNDIRMVEILPVVEKGYTATYYSDNNNTVHFRKTYRKNTTYSLPSNPSKEGFVFAGWTSSADSNTVEWNEDTKIITADKNWYPVWKQDNDLTYAYIDANGNRATIKDSENTGYLFSANSATAEYIVFEIDEVVNLTFENNGKTYNFIGFSTRENDFAPSYSNENDVYGLINGYPMFGQPVVLYAVYSTILYAEYDVLNGSNAPKTDEITICKSAGAVNIQSQVAKFNLSTELPSHEDAVLEGWVYQNRLYKIGTQMEITTDIVVTARWKYNHELLGNGTATNPYLINDAKEFTRFTTGVNDGTYTNQHFKLSASFEIPYFIPAGTYDKVLSKIFAFNGVFDGNYQTITVTGTNYAKENYVGVFGYNSGTIKNLKVEGVMLGNSYVAGICGYNNGTILECYNNAEVIATGEYIGGICGINNKLVDKVYNNGLVTTQNTSGNYVGGISGYNSENSVIRNAENLAEVSAENYQNVGGITGQNLGKLANVSNQGDILAKSIVGGLVGQNSFQIFNSFNGGTARSLTNYAGCVVGKNNSGMLNNVYYFINSGFDGDNKGQKAIGNANIGAVSIDPDSVQSFNTEGAGAGVMMGEVLRSLSYALDVGIEAYATKDGAVYCSWVQGENGYPTLYVNGKWTGIISQGSSVVGWTGTGTIYDPYLIGSIVDLQLLSEKVAVGLTYKDSYFKQTYDITFTDSLIEEWTPIGGYNQSLNKTYMFEGIFDGNGFTIYGLFTNTTENYVGLFGYNAGVIQNVTLENCDFTGGSYTAGIAGYNKGTIINCKNSSSVKSVGSYVGGIAGSNSGLIDRCITQNIIDANASSGANVGGITGENTSSSEIRNSISFANIEAETLQTVGGIAGLNSGKIINCANQGDITASSYVGGIAGKNNQAGIFNVYNSGHIKSLNYYAGGVVGLNTDSTIENTYYLFKSATDVSQNSQGAVGSSDGTVQIDPIGVKSFDQNLNLNISLSGLKIQNLIWALNVGQSLYDAQQSGMYAVWSVGNNSFPTLIQQSDWNKTTLWEFEGYGTQSNPFKIHSQLDLFYFALFVNSGHAYEGTYFCLTADLNLQKNDEYPLSPIGFYNPQTQTLNYFSGTFDGNNYKISGLNLNTDNSHQGLFGCNNGTIKNVGVAGNVQGGDYVGAVCGYNMGLIENCYSQALVKTTGSYAGGIVGLQDGTVNKCYNLGTVEGDNSVGFAIGGIAGKNQAQGKIINSFNEGTISANNYQWIGGISGQNLGEIKNTYAKGMVHGDYYIGGIVGKNDSGEIISNYSTASVISNNAYVGAITGYNNGKLNYNFYLKNTALDGEDLAQNGIGNQNIGQVTVDIKEQTLLFDENGKIDSVVLNGITVTSVYDGLTMAHAFLASKQSNMYCIWTLIDSDYPLLASQEVPVFWNPYFNESNLQGSGTLDEPYTIYTLEDFDVLRLYVNSGITYKDMFIKLMNNIDVSQKQWSPIGWYNTETDILYHFAGTFDGNGYEVTGLTINNSQSYQGLFGYSVGTIKNLTVNGSIKGDSYVGAVVGRNDGNVLNCTSKVSVIGQGNFVGGIVGYNNGKINRCVNLASLSAESSTLKSNAGGIAGLNSTTAEITNSYSLANIDANAYHAVGGLVGNNQGLIKNSYFDANVSAKEFVGGIAGQNDSGVISNCVNYGKVSSLNSFSGAITGYNNAGTLSNNYYLHSVATDGNGYVQNGVGADELDNRIADISFQTLSFNENLEIATTNVLGVQTASLIEALNTFVFSERSNAVVNDAWQILANDKVGFGFVDYVLFGTRTEKFAGGDGSYGNPYKISNANQLKYFADNLKTQTYANTHFVLTNDIYLNSINVDESQKNANVWMPIKNFEGNLNGNNFAIHGLFVNTLKDNQGLFEVNNGQISSLCLFNGYVEGLQHVASFAGTNQGQIFNCFNSNKILGYGNNIGGIAGSNFNQIDNCRNTGEVSGFGENIGGIAGYTVDSITNSFNVAHILVNGNKIGGITGYASNCTIANCYNTATVSGQSIVGGIAGQNNGEVVNCYNLGEIVGQNNYLGAVVGQNNLDATYNYYLRNNIISGIGSFSNQTTDIATLPFSDDFIIQATNVCGESVTKLIDALNAWVSENQILNQKLMLSWTIEQYPVFKQQWSGGENIKYSGGNGTKFDPYVISTAEDLSLLSSSVNSGQDYLNKYFVLANDIALNNETFTFEEDTGLVKVTDSRNVAYLGTGIVGTKYGPNSIFDYSPSLAGVWYTDESGTLGNYQGKLNAWKPIGSADQKTGTEYNFAGHFDGNGHKITGLFINNDFASQALFGISNGVIKNLGVENGFVCASNYVSSIIGNCSGPVDSVYSSITVLAKNGSAGGVCGIIKANGILNNAFNTGIVWGKQIAGGVIAEAYGKAENLYTFGSSFASNQKAQIIGNSQATTSNLFVWHESGEADEKAQIVNIDSIDHALTELNKFAKANNYLEWKIDLTTGKPFFSSHVVWQGDVATNYEGGTGTQENPYLIASGAQFAYFSLGNNRGSYAKIIKDIYLNDESFTYISDSGLIKVTDGINTAYLGTGIKGDKSGENSTFDQTASQKGKWYSNDLGILGEYTGSLNIWSGVANLKTHLDGAGHTIYGLYSTSNGLVQDMQNGSLTNLKVADSLVTGQNVGTLVSAVYGGTLSGLTNSGIVLGDNVGGIVGNITSNVQSKKSNADGSGYTVYTAERTTVSLCENTGTVIGENAGGIVGTAEFVEKLLNCKNHGAILATKSAGAIINAYNGNYKEENLDVNISSCLNYGLVQSNGYASGFIASFNGGTYLNEQYSYKQSGRWKTGYKEHYPANVSVINISNFGIITGLNYTAGIMAEASKGDVKTLVYQNCNNYGKISGLNYSAGIIGRATYISMQNCNNYGDVSGTTYVGGIVGYGAQAITNAVNKGKITGSSYVGGVVGYSYNENYEIKNVYNFGDATGSNIVGGIAGSVEKSKISNAYNGANVLVVDNTAGGIVGKLVSGTLTNAHNTGFVNGTYYVGGIAGQSQNNAVYSECYYGYGMISASSSYQKEQYGVGVSNASEPVEDSIAGINRYTKDMLFAVLGNIDITNQSSFFDYVGINTQGGGIYHLETSGNNTLLNGKAISSEQLGLEVRGTTYVMAYKASAPVTLYVNGRGQLTENNFGWNVAGSGENASKVLVANMAVGELAVPVDEHYTFAGWYVDSACLNKLVSSQTTYDFSFTKLYAKWVLSTFVLTLDTEGICQIPQVEGWGIGADGYTASKYITYLSVVGQLPELNLAGHVFDGWYTDKTYTKKISSASTYLNHENITLYPKFIKNSFAISIRLDNVDWVNSGITIEVYRVDDKEELVLRQENLIDSSIVLTGDFEEGYYQIYGSRKANAKQEMFEVGSSIFVSGKVNFVVDYYSLTLTKTEGINSVYILQENGETVNGVDIHNNAQIYLRGQTVVISAVVSEGAGYEFDAWQNLETNDQISQIDQELVMDKHQILKAFAKFA